MVVVFSALSGALLYLTARDGVAGLVADDAIYLLMADHFSPYGGTLSESAASVQAYARFPPLYPFLLALAGGGSDSLVTAHMVTTGFLLAAVAAYYLWLRRELDEWWLASGLALLFALLPTTLLHALELWSEHLYLMISMLVLLAVADSRRDPRLWLAGALLVGAAVLTRAAGFSLLAAFVVYVYLNCPPRRWQIMAAALILPVAWVAYNFFDATRDANVEFLLTRYADDPIVTIVTQLGENAAALWSGWGASFDAVGTKAGPVLAAIIAIPCLAGFVWRLTRLRFDAIYLACYLGLILVWPNSDHARRFLFVLMPVLLFQGTFFLHRLVAPQARAPLTKAVTGGFLILTLVTAAPSVAALIGRLLSPVDADIRDFTRTEYWLVPRDPEVAESNIRLLSHVMGGYRLAGEYVAPGECVYASHPEMFMFYARRGSMAPPIPTVADADFRRQLARCRYVFVSWMSTHPYLAPGYPFERMDTGEFVYVTRLGEQLSGGLIDTQVPKRVRRDAEVP